eukprot:scaffold112526_cov44-Cyclotella_meneghiniana.AAC.1
MVSILIVTRDRPHDQLSHLFLLTTRHWRGNFDRFSTNVDSASVNRSIFLSRGATDHEVCPGR